MRVFTVFRPGDEVAGLLGWFGIVSCKAREAQLGICTNIRQVLHNVAQQNALQACKNSVGVQYLNTRCLPTLVAVKIHASRPSTVDREISASVAGVSGHDSRHLRLPMMVRLSAQRGWRLGVLPMILEQQQRR